jgi:predicted AlkP superfamily phosphohydrolase/phosphomutase
MTNASKRKVLVLGIDGLDPRICRSLMADGALPHFAALAENGTFSELATVNPPQSPVAWAGIATGVNPGRHGIFDFIIRNPKTLIPELSIIKLKRSKLSLGASKHVLPFAGTPFWEVAAESGAPSTVIRWPVTFPPSGCKSSMLAGLGAPDVKGRLGNYVFYAESPEDPGGKRGTTVPLAFCDGRASTKIEGPMTSSLGKAKSATIPLLLARSGRGLSIEASGQTAFLLPGEWSDWLSLSFDVGRREPVKGIVRFHLSSLEPLGLYLSPVQIDPSAPCFPLAAPEGYARELVEALGGPYATLGMPEETKGLTDGVLNDEAFLSMCEDISTEREKMLDFELGRFNEGLLACVFDASDRIQHMFWRLFDQSHPLYDAKTAQKLGPVIEDHYRRMDAMLGRSMAAIDQNTALFVCSDHGFSSYSRSVNLNTWLAEAGYLSLKDHDPEDSGELFKHVNWSSTRAYALGFGSIYVNLAGREKYGQVRPGEEADALARELAERLGNLADVNGAAAVNRVHFKKDVYSGPLEQDAPELVVGYHPPYRASWVTAIGGVGKTVFEDNRQKWSGDHCVDASLVPGTLFSNLRLKGAGGTSPKQTRFAATVCRALGLEPGADMETSLM